MVTYDSELNAFILDQDREEKFFNDTEVVFTRIEAQDKKFF